MNLAGRDASVAPDSIAALSSSVLPPVMVVRGNDELSASQNSMTEC